MTKVLKKIDPDTHFRILNLLEDDPNITQRELAKKVGISLGSANYCLKSLIDIGHIKARNFKKNPDKFAYFYILTPKGIAGKAKLTAGFLKRKLAEYYSLKQEIEAIKSKSKRV